MDGVVCPWPGKVGALVACERDLADFRPQLTAWADALVLALALARPQLDTAVMRWGVLGLGPPPLVGSGTAGLPDE